MSTQVNSPFLLSKLRPVGDMTKQENNYHDQIERILQQLYRRSGGTVDTTDDNLEESSANENQIAFLNGQFSSLYDKVGGLEQDVEVSPVILREFRAVTKSESYTASDYDFINAKSCATITLPQFPVGNSVIIVRNGDGSIITIDGNQRNINGDACAITRRFNTSLVLHYFIDSNEWFIR